MPARGRHPHNRLTAIMVRQAPPGRHADGNCLYLYVRPTCVRHWVQRLTIKGLRTDLGLGSVDLVTLAQARRLAIENRWTVLAGGDPREAPGRKKVPTFRAVYEDATRVRMKGWDTAASEASWRRGFENYVLPAIGPKRVDAVTVADLRKILLPHWNGRHSVGYILRQNLEYVLETAVIDKHRTDNPG